MNHLPATIASIPEAAAWLKNGGVIAHPTDTCYGFAALVNDKQAVEKLRKVKGSEPEKPLSILVSSLQMAEIYSEFSSKSIEMAKMWPASLTLLLPKRETVPTWVTRNRFIGVRIPDHQWTLHLIEALGEPIVTSSANRTGGKELYDSVEVAAEFGNEAVLLIEGGSIPQISPSTIVRVSDRGMEILRQGSLRVY